MNRGALALALVFSAALSSRGRAEEPCVHEGCGGSDRDAAGCCVKPPTPMAPAPDAKSSSPRPTFRWSLDARADGARVEICAKPSCSDVIRSWDIAGTSGPAPADLPSSVLYWRLHSRKEGGTFGAASKPRKLTIGSGAEPLTGPPGRIYHRHAVEILSSSFLHLVPIDLKPGDRVVLSHLRVRDVNLDEVDLQRTDVSEAMRAQHVKFARSKVISGPPQFGPPPGAPVGMAGSMGPYGPQGLLPFMYGDPSGGYSTEDVELAPNRSVILHRPVAVRVKKGTGLAKLMGEIPLNVPFPELIEAIASYMLLRHRLKDLRPLGAESACGAWKLPDDLPPIPSVDVNAECTVSAAIPSTTNWFFSLPPATYRAFFTDEPAGAPTGLRTATSLWLGDRPAVDGGFSFGGVAVPGGPTNRLFYRKFLTEMLSKPPASQRFAPLSVPFLSDDEFMRVILIPRDHYLDLQVQDPPIMGTKDLITLVADIDIFRTP